MKLTEIQGNTRFGYSKIMREDYSKKCKPTPREVGLMVENAMLKHDLRNACRIIAVYARNEDVFLKG